MKVRILSLFDGISCGRVAFERAGIPVAEYHACEIDKYAIKVSQDNWPDIIHHGSVTEYHPDRHFDYLIGGSPCQGFSFAGKQLNFDDPRSALFWEFIRILDECRAINLDIKFLLENVRMDKRSEGVISDALGTQPVLINSALVSAQNRERLYWTNIGSSYIDLTGMRHSTIPQPQDKGVLLKDIIEDGAVDRQKSYCIDANYFKGGGRGELLEEGQTPNRSHQSKCRLMVKKIVNVNPSGNGMNGNVYDEDGKSPTLTTNKGEGVKVRCAAMVGRKINPDTGLRDDYNPDLCAEQRIEVRDDEKSGCLTSVQKDNLLVKMIQLPHDGNKGYEKGVLKSPSITTAAWQYNNLVIDAPKITYRKLTVNECCRLQTLPDDYCKAVSNSQAYKALGNGWTVDVIVHILKEHP